MKEYFDTMSFTPSLSGQSKDKDNLKQSNYNTDMKGIKNKRSSVPPVAKTVTL